MFSSFFTGLKNIETLPWSLCDLLNLYRQLPLAKGRGLKEPWLTSLSDLPLEVNYVGWECIGTAGCQS